MPVEKTTCPVCNEPVGNDPHEECLASVKALVQEMEGELPPMPCPACGQPMEQGRCVNDECEE